MNCPNCNEDTFGWYSKISSTPIAPRACSSCGAKVTLDSTANVSGGLIVGLVFPLSIILVVATNSLYYLWLLLFVPVLVYAVQIRYAPLRVASSTSIRNHRLVFFAFTVVLVLGAVFSSDW